MSAMPTCVEECGGERKRYVINCVWWQRLRWRRGWDTRRGPGDHLANAVFVPPLVPPSYYESNPIHLQSKHLGGAATSEQNPITGLINSFHHDVRTPLDSCQSVDLLTSDTRWVYVRCYRALKWLTPRVGWGHRPCQLEVVSYTPWSNFDKDPTSEFVGCFSVWLPSSLAHRNCSLCIQFRPAVTSFGTCTAEFYSPSTSNNRGVAQPSQWPIKWGVSPTWRTRGI